MPSRTPRGLLRAVIPLTAFLATLALPALAAADVPTVTVRPADAALWVERSADASVPGPPVPGPVTAGDGSAVVHWAPSGSDGGAPVTGYVVAAYPSGVVVTAPADARVATVPGLPNGVPTTFTVAAANAAGQGSASAVTAAVTPREPARLVVPVPPARQVVHGTVTVVNGSLLTALGVGVPGQRVDLMAQVRPSTAWRRVASGTTDSAGRVSLRAVLPASSALRLHHPASAVAARDLAVRSVLVAARVDAVASSMRIRAGQTLVVRGAVAPAHAAGSGVLLQRYVSGAWQTVALGRMTTTAAYGVSWRPGAGAYTLRVVKPADADHVAGTSRQWRQLVVPETAAEVAAAILRNPRVTLATVHVGGVADGAHARQNVADVAAGRPARRSAYGNAPGGWTALDLRVLRAVRQMGVAGTVTVSEIAGGSHARGSAHYAGRGLDVSWVDGRHVGRGSGYAMALDACRAHGASRIFHPSYDPYGGHHNHVHCEWS